MSISMIIPFIIGTFGILQGTINKQLAQDLGLSVAAFWTSLQCTILTVILYYFTKYYQQVFPSIFHIKSMPGSFQWWYLLPGFFGFCIIVGLPFAFYKLGAVKVTIILIAAQMIASVIWDMNVDKIPMTSIKILGLVFAATSVGLITFSK